MSCCRSEQSACCKNNQSGGSDHLVCTCMGVMYSEICDAIDKGANTFDALSEQLGVGTGCSSCVQEVHQILQSRLQKCCKK